MGTRGAFRAGPAGGPTSRFSGAEISAREGHFLVYGLPSLEEVPPGVELAALLRVVRKHEAAIVAAHPFRWDQPFDAIVAEHGPVFDALELVSKNVTARYASPRRGPAPDSSHGDDRLERRP